MLHVVNYSHLKLSIAFAGLMYLITEAYTFTHFAYQLASRPFNSLSSQQTSKEK